MYKKLKSFSFFLVLFSLISVFFFAGNIYAQQTQRIEIPASPNPVGSGARSLGMGGAFIGVADDATAASWNPGGLIQLEKPEFSVVGAWFKRDEKIKFGTNPEASGLQSVNKASLNYFSFALPFQFEDYNMIISLNYQHLYDFTRKWNFPIKTYLANGNFDDSHFDYKQEGGLYAWGFAYCVQLTPSLSIGGTLNIWDNWPSENGWQQKYQTAQTGYDTGSIYQTGATSKDKYNFKGVNFNLGMMWNVTGNFTVGAVFKSPFRAVLKHRSEYTNWTLWPDFPAANTLMTGVKNTTESLDMPTSYGIGFSYRFNDAFTVSADVYRTEWRYFIQRDADGNNFSPISGKAKKDSNVQATHQVRVGAEYLLIGDKTVLPLRAGVFYDPSPSEGAPDNYFGFSAGSGLTYDIISFDVAFQYRFGVNVGKDILSARDFSEDLNEYKVYSSIIIHL
ncbi:MAG: outer membrane protein transport protein [Pseudomonadota bacterium]